MNPLFLLLGLFGSAAIFGSGSSTSNALSTGSTDTTDTDTGTGTETAEAKPDTAGTGVGNGKGQLGAPKQEDDDTTPTEPVAETPSEPVDDGAEDTPATDDGETDTETGGMDMGGSGDETPETTGSTDDHSGHDMGETGGSETTDETPTDTGNTDDHSGHDMGETGGSETTDETPTDTGNTDDHSGHDMGETGGSEGGMGDHSGHDHGTPDIPPPGADASAAEISAYLAALAAAPEVHVHDAGTAKAPEHDALLDLVPRGGATHVAIADGDWFDPAIWANGEVPGTDAKVLIPEGVSIDYSGVSDAELFTLRVDGHLEFDPTANSQMIFDTFVITPTGHLVMGTEANPVAPNVDIDLIVANNGPIDTNWDPMLLSRGLISHGDVTVHGAEKDSHEKVDTDPMSGDTSISFAEVPTGWQVGDTIVIAGTKYEGYNWDNDVKAMVHNESEDEIRVITEILEDGTVRFDTPLEHDHDTPRADLKTSVANYTRNVSIETEDGDDLAAFERGHVMFMHSDNVDVRYMEFTELGRTDKSFESKNINDFDTVDFDTNVQGRYALHLHRTGVDDVDNPTILEGNAVFGSPGWGIVHHDSNAMITNNATFDTFGAGYVAETGNEIGGWHDNIAIYAIGQSWGIPKNNSLLGDKFDTGNGGEGFWFQGRMVESTDNVAASVNIGFAYVHRGGGMLEFDSELFELPAALHFDETVWPDDAPIRSFESNEAFAAHEGLHVVKSNTEQNHDVWTHLDDFTAWSVKTGVHLQYTSHYLLTNFDLIGKDDTPFSPADEGILFGTNLSEIVIRDSQITNFDTGIDLTKDFVRSTDPLEWHDYVVIDTQITDVNQQYANYDPSLDLITTDGALPGLDPNLTIDGPLVFDGGTLELTGTKTDGLGSTRFPGGIDNFDLLSSDVARILEKTGYWTTSDGQAYTLLDVYFTDRPTGEIYHELHPIYINDNIPLGSEIHSGGRYAEAQDNGTQDIVTVGGTQMAGPYALDTPVPALEAVAPSTTMTQTATAADTDMGFMSMDPGFDTIAEFRSMTPPEDDTAAEAEPAAPAPEEGSTLSVELAGLSAADGTALSLMSQDELSALFEDATETGLGERDAMIKIDYEGDCVTLELSEGSGEIAVETHGTAPQGGSDSLWAALTGEFGPVCAQNVVALDDDAKEDEEIEQELLPV